MDSETQKIWIELINNGGKFMVEFKCPDGEAYGFEPLITKKSEYLRAAFSGHMIESTEKVLQIDTKAEVVKIMLQHLHIGFNPRLENLDDAFSLFDLARKWLIPWNNDMHLHIIGLNCANIGRLIKAAILAQEYKFDKLFETMVNHIANLLRSCGNDLKDGSLELLLDLPETLKNMIITKIYKYSCNTFVRGN